MKVLHFVSIMNRAGQETFIMNMYRNMDREKIQFGFLCSVCQKGDYDDEIHEMGGEIHYIKLDEKQGKLRHWYNYQAMKKEFHKYVTSYDAIHIHNYHAFDTYLSARAALKAGFQKVIVHSHNCSADAHLQLHQLCKPFLSRLPVVKLACSQDAGKWMYTNEDFTVIPNGINVDTFVFNEHIREKYRKELMLEDRFVIGHVGRFEPQKNHKFIIDVFAKFVQQQKDAYLLLVGTGVLMDEMKQYVHELGIDSKVCFMGMRTDVPQLYQAFDMFFFPSLFEGLGIVAVEAQTADLPCLISDVIPHDIDILDEVVRCSLQDDLQNWTDCLQKIYNLNKTRVRSNVKEQIIEVGFDEKESSKKLADIYMA